MRTLQSLACAGLKYASSELQASGSDSCKPFNQVGAGPPEAASAPPANSIPLTSPPFSSWSSEISGPELSSSSDNSSSDNSTSSSSSFCHYSVQRSQRHNTLLPAICHPIIQQCSEAQHAGDNLHDSLGSKGNHAAANTDGQRASQRSGNTSVAALQQTTQHVAVQLCGQALFLVTALILNSRACQNWQSFSWQPSMLSKVVKSSGKWLGTIWMWIWQHLKKEMLSFVDKCAWSFLMYRFWGFVITFIKAQPKDSSIIKVLKVVNSSVWAEHMAQVQAEDCNNVDAQQASASAYTDPYAT